MKLTIYKKLLFLLIALAVLPLAIVSLLSIKNAKSIGEMAVYNSTSLGNEVLSESTTIVKGLGAGMIKQKAEDVARQVAIYIQAHPDMTIADLQADADFQKIAVQPVGETGYTALTDVSTLICRFHANPKIANLDLSNLSESLPGFWSVMSRSLGGQVAEGYYDWKEADGAMKQKYMYISIVDARTADGIQLSVAATTYIEEFSRPVAQIGMINQNAIDRSVAEIEEYSRFIMLVNLILILANLFLVLVVGFYSAKTLSQPIKDLKTAADKVTMGDFDVQLPATKGNDEIAELTASIEMLIAALKQKRGQ